MIDLIIFLLFFLKEDISNIRSSISTYFFLNVVTKKNIENIYLLKNKKKFYLYFYEYTFIDKIKVIYFE